MTYLYGLILIVSFMTILWLVSLYLTNASIVDPFWGFGFVLLNLFYFFSSGTPDLKKYILLALVTLWGLRLSIHLFIRNAGKGEDFRYRQFRKDYGEKRYWWVSFFQVFLLQAVLLWLVSAPLYAVNSREVNPGVFDYAGLAIWLIGFIFESGGDYQLSRFRANPDNRGKILDSGFWKYTRHPNYFGDAAVWWGFALLSIGSGGYIHILGSLLMTILLVRVSGVMLLEKSLKDKKPGYAEYISKTRPFVPWFPRKTRENG
ncbi:MAG: DUF1295 domain-containing protein [Bacteroidales bacterium]